MDKGKIIRLLLIPVIVGLVVTLIAKQLIVPPKQQASASQEETVPVVTISATNKEPIPAKTKLTEVHLAVKQAPKSMLTGSEFRAVADAVGMVTLVEMQPGEIVLKNRVVQESKGTLPFRIPAGTRASTIRIDEFSGVAGHPEPGDLVDLLLVLPAKAPERPSTTSRILFESVLVLGKGLAAPVKGGSSGGAAAGGEGAKLSSLTLALKPEAAAELALAEQLGLIKVLLRPALAEPSAGSVLINENKFGTTETRPGGNGR